MQRKEREVLSLPCVLKEDELRQKSIDLTEKLDEIENIEKELKNYQKDVKAQIEKLKSEENILRNQVSTGREYRKVECSIEYDWEKKTKFWVRRDTEITVKDEPIPEHEYQEEMKIREENEGNEELLDEEQEPDNTEEEIIDDPEPAEEIEK